ncbi:Apoptosis-inducing factor 2 [Hondaea fermentalgiana]|uniref:Apoptosis-inducing factor 2 n=1 Tax=Hondaea fermentalgiana TaxID=2315210 RepID=A0A2R5G2P6_9STRA|nr:Apoptosis-inducing factor 2 [Hondaea fermentalgiana]|eukprot:GBG25296.1 Apoptosis-inducing factor 2 [Hondaea fermentalgiana]
MGVYECTHTPIPTATRKHASYTCEVQRLHQMIPTVLPKLVVEPGSAVLPKLVVEPGSANLEREKPTKSRHERKEITMRVAIVGGGYGGVYLSKALEARNVDVVLVERNERFFHKIGGGRAFIESGFEEKVFLEFDELLQRRDSCVLIGEARALNVNTKTLSVWCGREADEKRDINFDAIVFAMGVRHTFGQLPDEGLMLDDLLATCKREQDRLAMVDVIVVVGGGALGIETSSQIADTYKDKTVHLLHSRGALMSGAGSKELGDLVKTKLEALGVNVHLGCGRIEKEDVQRQYPGSLVLMATGCRMSDSSRSLLDPRWINDETSEIRVGPSLRVENAPDFVYAIGDIAATGDYKQARWAHRHAEVVAANICGGNKIYQPLRSNPWFIRPLSYILCWWVRARVDSTLVIALKLGLHEHVMEFGGILFSDYFTRRKMEKDTGIAHVRKSALSLPPN